MYDRTANPKSHPRRDARENHKRIEEAIPPRNNKLLCFDKRATNVIEPKMQVEISTALIRIAGSSSIAYPTKGFKNIPVMNPSAKRA